MAYLKFLNSIEVYKCKVIPQDNIVTLKFDSEMEVSTAGFDLYLDEKCQTDIGVGFYHAFTTIYRNDDTTAEYNGYQISSDGSVYEEPEPQEPHIPTLEEVKSAKKTEIHGKANDEIISGVAELGHIFSYSENDMVSIRNAHEDTLASGSSAILRDAAGKAVELNADSVHSLYYEQEKNRIEKEAYAEQLVNTVDAMSDKESVQAVTYGAELQGEYLSAYNSRVETGMQLLNNSISASKAVQAQAKFAAVNNTDEQALAVKGLYKDWHDDPDGYSYDIDNPEDKRRNYNGGLWNLNKSHDKQASWYPGADPTLWTEIVEGHDGTYEDPIPVPDSVKTSGFEYEYGKYYLENGVIYLCQRGGVENPEEMYGQKEKLYYPPSELLEQYFVIA